MRKLLLALLLSGVSLAAAAAERAIDPKHSEIRFSVKQMGVPVEGQFRRFEARLAFDPAKPEASRAEISVDIASVDAGSAEADEVAVDKPWLDQAGFPRATFRSSAVRSLGGSRYEARGTLSIRGKAREISVPFSAQQQPDGATLLSGQFGIRRSDFGIGGGEWNESDLVANEVPVSFRLMLAPAR
ncbi:MAG TPA: YceI family protein [Solimonas sp.]|nr:YceI family protein [Solimonas sp.]